ncbi:hypothetical protein ACFFLM_04925 [Deinococcus oregonensis]|uniref:Lipoprotein n=1 Tax=Deinococcus oregonensis TaxID=1805970 RepID=A0ABV6AUY3_9DEIO
MKLQMTPWLLALPLWLASCGTSTLTAALPEAQTAPALQALDDCPSCGIMAPTPTFTEQFWVWGVPELEGPQQWTYSGSRQTMRGAEVFLVPAQNQSAAQFLSVGCLNSSESRSFAWLSRHAFQSTVAVDASAVTTSTDADALCSDAFGSGWHVARPQAASGFWALGERPGELAPQW